jgi:hypothetical protein
MHGGWIVDEHGVLGTTLHVELSGEVWKVTVLESVPPAAASVDRVILQLTQGVLPERFDTAVWVPSPVNLKVKEQSGLFCAASGRHTRRAA